MSKERDFFQEFIQDIRRDPVRRLFGQDPASSLAADFGLYATTTAIGDMFFLASIHGDPKLVLAGYLVRMIQCSSVTAGAVNLVRIRKELK